MSAKKNNPNRNLLLDNRTNIDGPMWGSQCEAFRPNMFQNRLLLLRWQLLKIFIKFGLFDACNQNLCQHIKIQRLICRFKCEWHHCLRNCIWCVRGRLLLRMLLLLLLLLHFIKNIWLNYWFLLSRSALLLYGFLMGNFPFSILQCSVLRFIDAGNSKQKIRELLTIYIHLHLKASFESTICTPITARFINDAIPFPGFHKRKHKNKKRLFHYKMFEFNRNAKENLIDANSHLFRLPMHV